MSANEITQGEACKALSFAAAFEGIHKAALDLVELLKMRLIGGSIMIYPEYAHEQRHAGLCAVAFEAAALGLVKVEKRVNDGQEFWVCTLSEVAKDG